MSLVEREVPLRAEESVYWSRHASGVETAARNRLRRSSYRELHHIFCHFNDGILSLRGRVPSFYLKQLAQTLLNGLEGVWELNNQLKVDLPQNY
jgi:hypothetical protein